MILNLNAHDVELIEHSLYEYRKYFCQLLANNIVDNSFCDDCNALIRKIDKLISSIQKYQKYHYEHP